MATATKYILDIDLDRRVEDRCSVQRFVKIQPLDMSEDYTFEALTEDVSDSGAALFARQPLPVGTHLKITYGEDFNAVGEVKDLLWCDWDRCGLVRIGVHLFDKSKNWPL